MLTAAVKAANESKIGPLMENVSESFTGPSGMNKREAKRYIFAKLYRKQWRRIFVYESKIQIKNKSSAQVNLKVILARGDDIRTLEDIKDKTNLDSFHLELQLSHADSAWLVQKAVHKRLRPEDL